MKVTFEHDPERPVHECIFVDGRPLGDLVDDVDHLHLIGKEFGESRPSETSKQYLEALNKTNMRDTEKAALSILHGANFPPENMDKLIAQHVMLCTMKGINTITEIIEDTYKSQCSDDDEFNLWMLGAIINSIVVK